MTEAELKREVLQIAYANGWLVYHHPATTVRGSQGRGYPDLTIARAGECIWVELKTQHGALTQQQEDWAAALPAEFYVIRPSDLWWMRLRLGRAVAVAS